jgi:hypothetical protein
MSLFPLGLLSQGGGAGAGTFELIQTATGTGSSGVVTFSSIPATYKHLQLRIVGRSTFANTGDEGATLTFNGVTSGYANHFLISDPSSVYAFSQTSQSSIGNLIFVPQNNQTSGYVSYTMIDVVDYTDTNKYKTVRGVNGYHGGTPKNLRTSTHYVNTTSAISSLTLTLSQGNWTTSSRLSLYGIRGS